MLTVRPHSTCLFPVAREESGSIVRGTWTIGELSASFTHKLCFGVKPRTGWALEVWEMVLRPPWGGSLRTE